MRKMKTQKKAQDIKMGETIMVLFVFVILLMFGLVFYVRWQKGDMISAQTEQTMKESVKIAQVFSSLPEVACSFDNVKKENCVDLLKIQKARDIISDHQSFYFSQFRYSEIIIYEIYPYEREWMLYENSLDDTTKLSTPIPVTIYDGTEKAYYFGVMEVNYYEPKRT